MIGEGEKGRLVKQFAKFESALKRVIYVKISLKISCHQIKTFYKKNKPMKLFITICACLFSINMCLAQTNIFPSESDNIIPNSSFEELNTLPIGWFYKGAHFTKIMKYWSSPTAASPDAFGQGIRVPTTWADKGFGHQSAHIGQSMVGLTIFGCENGKPHCREYVAVQLNEALVIGQHYDVEFWVSHLPRSLYSNNIGVYFSEKQLDVKIDAPLHFEPQVYSSSILQPKYQEWVKVSGEFKAEKEGEYLILGNFFPDSLTQTKVAGQHPFNYAYYYIDDIVVKKRPPILEVPIKDDDLTRVVLEEGKIVRLKNIYFETNKASLLPRSYVELKKLLQVLEKNPSAIIKINGHTDSKGEDEYNQALSERRAKAVVEFLNANGIPSGRVFYEGFGSTQPLDSNYSEEGRQLNRRVEFVVLSL